VRGNQGGPLPLAALSGTGGSGGKTRLEVILFAAHHALCFEMAGSKVPPRSHCALVRPPGISGYLFPTDETKRLGTTPGREPRSNSSCGPSGTGDEIRVAAEEVSFHRLPPVSVAFKRSDFCASSSVKLLIHLARLQTTSRPSTNFAGSQRAGWTLPPPWIGRHPRHSSIRPCGKLHPQP